MKNKKIEQNTMKNNSQVSTPQDRKEAFGARNISVSFSFFI